MNWILKKYSYIPWTPSFSIDAPVYFRGRGIYREYKRMGTAFISFYQKIYDLERTLMRREAEEEENIVRTTMVKQCIFDNTLDNNGFWGVIFIKVLLILEGIVMWFVLLKTWIITQKVMNRYYFLCYNISINHSKRRENMIAKNNSKMHYLQQVSQSFPIGSQMRFRWCRCRYMGECRRKYRSRRNSGGHSAGFWGV